MFNSYMQICTTTWNISFRRKGEEESVLKPWKRDKKKEEKSRLSSPSKQKYYQNHSSSTTRIQDRLSFFLAGMHPAVSYEKVGRGDCFFSGRGSVNKGASARCTVAKGWNRGGCSVAYYAVCRTIYIYIYPPYLYAALPLQIIGSIPHLCWSFAIMSEGATNTRILRYFQGFAWKFVSLPRIFRE